MSDYVTHLIARTLGLAHVAQPRIPARFEVVVPPDDRRGLDIQAGVESASQPTDIRKAVKDGEESQSPSMGARAPAPEPSARPQTPPPVQAPGPAPVSSMPIDAARAERTPGTSLDRSIVMQVVVEQTDVRSAANQVPPVYSPRPSRSLPTAEVREHSGKAPERSHLIPAATVSGVEGSVATRLTGAPTVLEPANRAPQGQPAPTINVRIGRIDVRAVAPSSSPSVKRVVARPPAQTPTLKDYLKRRREGGR